MTQQNYYQILAVSADADEKTIKEAYRKLAFKFHPDRNTGNLAASEKMKAVNEAYAVLSNPAKRREYDSLRQQFGHSAHHQFRQNYSEQDIFKNSDINHIFEEMARSFGLRGVDAIFSDYYGGRYKSFMFKTGGVSGSGIFGFEGGGKAKPRPKTRTENIIGKISQPFIDKAARNAFAQTGKDIQDTVCITPEFAGTGGPYAYRHKKKNKKLVIKIPPNVRKGQRIRLSGMGENGIAKPGDLYLKIEIKKPFIKKILNFFKNFKKSV